MHLKYIRSAIICRSLWNIPEVHVHDNFINFEIFLKMLDYFKIFKN